MPMKRFPAAVVLLFATWTHSSIGQESRDSVIRFFKDDQVAIGSAAVRLKRTFLVHSSSHKGNNFVTALGELEKSSVAGTIVKLHICIEPGSESLDAIAQAVSNRWPENAPAVTVVEAFSGAPVSLDAVWQSDSPENAELSPSDGVLSPERDIIHVSGRAAGGELVEATSGTMEQLFDVLRGIGADRESVVQIKAFIQPIDQLEVVRETISHSFRDLPVPPIVFVQWASASRATEIELVAEAPDQQEIEETISYHTPAGDKPSPVFSRVARVHGDEVIYIGGIVGTTNESGTGEVTTLYEGLKRVAALAGTDLRHLAKATYYVSDDGASTALNELRPSLYDPARPPAASKVQVPGVGISGRGILIDMIAAPSD